MRKPLATPRWSPFLTVFSFSTRWSLVEVFFPLLFPLVATGHDRRLTFYSIVCSRMVFDLASTGPISRTGTIAPELLF